MKPSWDKPPTGSLAAAFWYRAGSRKEGAGNVMFPFWDVVIAPVLEAIGAKRVVEIGALRGETTVLMLDQLGPDAELHVVDPAPEFDPAEHEKKFPGQYIFHPDISHNVLPHLPTMDAALIDGDHNWYTVYNELRMLSATAHEAGEPLPVLIMHDVGWPYGRRDLYYAPERIPEEFRQPYAQRGMRMDRKELLPRGGLNPTMFNAVTEGGPRNGVMTALDDFMAEHNQPLRRVVLPIYFGLAIVAENERLTSQPELARFLDWLEGNEGRKALLDLSESVRLQAMLFQHNVFFHRERQLERAASRYLELLKGALLDEHYLENELRIDYLARCVERGIKVNPVIVRDPARHQKVELRKLQAARRAGTLDERDGEPADYFPYTTMGRVRLDHLQGCLETIRTTAVDGDLVECGPGRGGGAIFLRGFLDAHEMDDRKVWVIDPFRASPTSNTAAGPESSLPGGGLGFPDLLGDLNSVRDGFARFDLLDDRVRFLQGPPGHTVADAPIEKVSLLRIGGDLDGAIGDVLDALYDKVAVGGFVVADQYGTASVQQAVEEFRSRRGIADPIERTDWVGAYWRKITPASISGMVMPSTSGRLERAPFPPPAPPAHKDLSVIVVFYNMRREAERTLHSLSRAYQRGIDDVDYEVIVVENGSGDTQKLGEEFVHSFGAEFRYLDLAAEATPSPAHALNRGVALANGDAFAFMIDGAHVLTPGVLRFGMAGLATYRPAIVATQQWYVGPGQQGDAALVGYDQEYEDRLFREIEWPSDGYRLFDIGQFIGDRDWFDGIWESNCMFVPRSILEQVGCFDESFSVPGGGYANLEFYERLGSSPDITVTTIIGEGSFHQVHGGTTTNESDTDERRRRIAGYAQQYAQVRGRPFRGPGRTMHFVGSMPPRAARTKARRRIAPNVFKAGTPDPDALPEKPLPIPEELKVEFVDAFWRSHAWRKTTWLGHSVSKPPTDLIAYQEMITRVRPDWIVETGTGNGGRALFLASICELLGHGRVLSIDPRKADDRPQHQRITYLTANPVHADTARRVRDIVGDTPNALVLLGSRGSRQRMVAEFTLFSPLVPLGSYVVMEETIVNGHPVWPSFGPGPTEAVKNVINTRGDFAPDPDMERSGLTFNPHGFLKRVQ
jgi:cephalosporin hydroxylase